MTQVFSPLPHLGALALIAAFTSALIGIAVGIGGHWLARRAPAGQSRLLLAAAFAPVYVTTIVLAAALADWQLIHGPANFCRTQHATAHLSILLSLVFTGFCVRVSLFGACVARDLWRAAQADRAFQSASATTVANCRVLSLAEPQAFVLGIVHPRVYVSEGLLHALPAEGRVQQVCG